MTYFFTMILMLWMAMPTASHGQGQIKERIGAFNIQIFPTKIKVVSPSSRNSPMFAVVENKALIKTLGKIERESGEVISYIYLDSQEFKSVRFPLGKKETLYYVPLSPPYQKVSLIVDQSSYEIPPKR